jgi:hypothetical protein
MGIPIILAIMRYREILKNWKSCLVNYFQF